MPIENHRRVAANLLKCGVTRVRIMDAKAVLEALTREDIRGLIKNGSIVKVQKKGTTKALSKKIKRQKARGRRFGTGSKKGKQGARAPPKERHIRRIRGMRKSLNDLKVKKELSMDDYRLLYRRVKGGVFRSKRHLLTYIAENKLRIKKK
ncbi:MAG: 50S ribosomal protein L19e [Nanoarchaeota archaeon]|nr:50S ribosomal protein L19e [Nanoarchaeota archaeon]